jgi:hypothetical protein
MGKTKIRFRKKDGLDGNRLCVMALGSLDWREDRVTSVP